MIKLPRQINISAYIHNFNKAFTATVTVKVTVTVTATVTVTVRVTVTDYLF